MRSGGSRRGARGCRAPLSLDRTEVQRAEKNFFETTPPNLSQGLDDPPSPCYLKVWIRHWCDLLFWEVKLFHFRFVTKPPLVNYMPRTRQWEIQNSMFRTPVHCFFSSDFLRAQNMVRVIESKINIDKTSALEVFCSCSFILRANFETSLVMVDYGSRYDVTSSS